MGHCGVVVLRRRFDALGQHLDLVAPLGELERGAFVAIRDSMPDSWGRRVIERNAVLAVLAGLGLVS